MNKYTYKVVTLVINTTSEQHEFGLEGAFITHIEGDINIQIRLDDRSQDAIPLTPQNSINMPENIFFKKFFVSGTGTAGTIKLFVGKPSMVIDIGQVYIAGTVRTLNEPTLEAALDQSYFMGSYNQVGTAIHHTSIGLWNPTTSGVNLFVDKWKNFLITTTGNIFSARFINDITYHTLDSARAYHFNKKAGGADPAGVLVYGQIDATELAAIEVTSDLFRVNHYITNVGVPAWDISAPVCIPPGFGIVSLQNWNTSYDTGLDVQWHEKGV